MESIIHAHALTLKYLTDTHPIIDQMNFEILHGEFVVLTGKSGSGKTTFLKSIYGEKEIDGGSLKVCGLNMSKLSSNQLMLLRRHLGIIFQDYRLVDEWTVAQNVMLPLKIQGYSHSVCVRQVEKVLSHVKLLHKSQHFSYQLSGGEQQRIGVARAIVHNPLFIIADEPTGNLDTYSTEVIWNLLQGINKNLGTTILLATHQVPNLSQLSFKHYNLHEGQCKNASYRT